MRILGTSPYTDDWGIFHIIDEVNNTSTQPQNDPRNDPKYDSIDWQDDDPQ